MTTRRLAAILAADVVGFSSMMEKDEEGTLERVKALQREVIEPRPATGDTSGSTAASQASRAASRCSSPPKTCPSSVTPNQSNPLCRGTSWLRTTYERGTSLAGLAARPRTVTRRRPAGPQRLSACGPLSLSGRFQARRSIELGNELI